MEALRYILDTTLYKSDSVNSFLFFILSFFLLIKDKLCATNATLLAEQENVMQHSKLYTYLRNNN